MKEIAPEWIPRNYKGRKPIPVDCIKLEDVMQQLEEKKIHVEDAMKQLGLTSRSTFYRKKQEYLQKRVKK